MIFKGPFLDLMILLRTGDEDNSDAAPKFGHIRQLHKARYLADF